MNEREKYFYYLMYWIIGIFASQLLVNVVVLGITIYLGVKSMAFHQGSREFYGWAKETLAIVKGWVDVVTRERSQVAQVVQENAHAMQEKMEQKGEEIKQAIQENATGAKNGS